MRLAPRARDAGSGHHGAADRELRLAGRSQVEDPLGVLLHAAGELGDHVAGVGREVDNGNGEGPAGLAAGDGQQQDVRALSFAADAPTASAVQPVGDIVGSARRPPQGRVHMVSLRLGVLCGFCAQSESCPASVAAAPDPGADQADRRGHAVHDLVPADRVEVLEGPVQVLRRYRGRSCRARRAPRGSPPSAVATRFAWTASPAARRCATERGLRGLNSRPAVLRLSL